MSEIRRQSIISSLIVYIGFVVGFLNSYLFVREGGFTQAQYGLTGLFISIATIMFSIANLGMTTYIYKFYPFYKDNLPDNKNDILTWAVLVSTIGFILIAIAGFVFKDVVIRKFITNSSDLITYYYWIFPFGYGLTLYSVMESYAWQQKLSVFTNYLRELQFRLFTSVLIILSLLGILPGFGYFIKFYSFNYLIIAITLICFLAYKGKLHFSFSVSRVSKKFYKKIITLALFVFGGSVISTVSAVIGTIIIASVVKNGLALAGVYTLSQFMSSIIQAPQRGIISSSIPVLSQAWKDKDLGKISRIYHRSSINQLIFATAIFALIWLNFEDGIKVFAIQKDFSLGKYAFFFLGLMRIIDMGTGVNAQIIGTSNQWRFDFFTGIILILLALPLNYFLTKSIGINGPPIADLISFAIWNALRYYFLLSKYKLQPFNSKTLLTIVFAIVNYFTCYYLFRNQHNLVFMIIRSLLFVSMSMIEVLYFRLTPDIIPVWNTLLKKVGLRTKDEINE